MAEEKFGIDDFEQAVKFAAGVAKKVKDALADKKVSLTEVFTIAASLVEVPDIIEKKDKIAEQAMDLSFAEVQRLKAAYAGIADEKVTDLITAGLNVFVSVKEIYLLTKAKEVEAPQP